MKKSKSIDRETLRELSSQISELSRLLSGEDNHPLRNTRRNGKPFLFGFDIEGPATGEEYGRYFAYMEMIRSILRDFGIRIGNNGYSFIVDAVKIIIDRGDYDLRLKTDIYPVIAGRYHMKNPAAVEHSIRNAINTAYEDYRKDQSVNSMGTFQKRPTNKEFLFFVTDTVSRCMCESLIKTAG